MQRDIVIFDLGGVLIDWNPRYLYHPLFLGNEGTMEWFLAEVCPQSWNEAQDAGRSIAEAEAEAIARHPDQHDRILAYYQGFDIMMRGALAGTVALLERLDAAGVPLYALTNFSAETFPLAQRRFAFLSRFRGIVVSGQEKIIKPDPRLYQILLDRYGLDPHRCIYIDDVARNLPPAAALGIHTILFTGAEALAQELATCLVT